jgi:hypothetical protein
MNSSYEFYKRVRDKNHYELKLNFYVEIYFENGMYVIGIPEYDIYTNGDTIEDSKKQLIDLVGTLLGEAVETAENGFNILGSN